MYLRHIEKNNLLCLSPFAIVPRESQKIKNDKASGIFTFTRIARSNLVFLVCVIPVKKAQEGFLDGFGIF